MKKMMTAFAACMIAGLVSAQVESQNIVGYQTKTVPAGFTAVSPTFLTPGGAAITFSAITGTFGWGDQLQFFDAAGNVNFFATWCLADIDGVPSDGWYSVDGAVYTSLADTQIPAGQAFFASLSSEGSITVSGEVGTSDVTVTSVEGFVLTGNCTPVSVKYGDLVCTDIGWGDQIQFFDESGNVVFFATWCLADIDGVPADGWYSVDGAVYTSLATTEIPAGQGFFLSTAAAGATVKIPAPAI